MYEKERLADRLAGLWIGSRWECFPIKIHLHLMRYLFTAVVSLCWLAVPAQSVTSVPAPPISSLFGAPDYPQHYFRDPLGIPMSLAANFGELRPNHFHMGLDIRTQHRENLPVYAAADGYIARVEIGPFGFGQAIYIRHPNGYTTVYGHLNRFVPALAEYVEREQYRQQSWSVDLAIPPGLFPVKQGDQIAWSGNTGGSQGPHLHFEIRRTAGDVNLNPLLFGLPVEDRVPPKITLLAWYDGNQGIYDQSPHILPAQFGRLSGNAALTVPVSRIGFAISASDAQSGSSNPNGIYRAVLEEDNRPILGFQLDHISYDDTRNVNAHIDYKTRLVGGPFLQQLFFLPGYPFPSIYRIPGPTGGVDPAAHGGNTAQRRRVAVYPDDGFIDLSDGRPHAIGILVSDTRDNRTRIEFTVQYRPQAAMDTVMSPAEKKFYPGMVDGAETADYAFYLGEKSLYDSATIGITVAGYPGSGLSLPGGVTPVYTIGARWIPLLDPVLVRLHLPDSNAFAPAPTSGAPASTSGAMPPTDRIVMVCFDGADKVVQLPEWKDGWASGRFREFGNFQLVYDSIAPVITPIGPLEGADLSHAARIAFRVSDNLGALRRFRAELDGRWLCFTNDKALAYIYKFDGHCPPGPHTLKVTVEDVAGNRSEKEYHFNR
jgi:murein DD-endopeptidase MepM/ murein hydrolase activator NlpD